MKTNKLFVGNISFDATEGELEDLFAQHGSVVHTILMQDRMTGKPRGFGFVTMQSEEEAQAAMENLNGKDFKGRNLTVNEARPRPQDKPGFNRF